MRRPERTPRSVRIFLVSLPALALCLAAGQLGAQSVSKKGGGTPSPDIVYMSYGASGTFVSTAIRGIALANDGLSGRDLQLQKARAGRGYANITWSPDGKRMAWIEGSQVLVGAPGSRGAAVHAASSDYVFDSAPGGLAWGPGCEPGTSVLVFRNISLVFPGIWAIEFAGDQPSGDPFWLFEMPSGEALSGYFPSGLTFSPEGQYLAFGGSGIEPGDGGYGLWVLPMCSGSAAPTLLTGDYQVGPWGGPIVSADWSPSGDRLALSVIAPRVADRWLDIDIVYLDYAFSGGTESVSFVGRSRLDLDAWFTAESSEHSPRWGPMTTAYSGCQRIAFSQSSNVAPRSLYLVDVGADGLGGCALDTPLKIAAKEPRALDWK